MADFEISSRLGPGTGLALATLPAYQASLDCVHCGYCLTSCATYRVTGLEPSSPRGRIVLMKGFAEGTLALEGEAARHLDDCLGCRACETVCPAGVRYGEMLEVVRDARAARDGAARAAPDRTTRLRDFALGSLTDRRVSRVVGAALRLYVRSGARRIVHRLGWIEHFGARLRMMEALIPEDVRARSPRRQRDSSAPMPASPAARPRRVALFRGCVGDALFSHVGEHASRLLTHYGYEVVPIPNEECCGALDLHAGRHQRALALARRNLDAVEAIGGIVFIASSAAGCGAMLRDLSRHFGDAPGVAAIARRFESRARDVTELIAGGTPRTPPGSLALTATYHPPCHLLHAQRVAHAPLAVLRSIPDLTLVPLEGAEICCGSAGVYNVLRPEMASRVLTEKIDAIRDTGASLLVTGNPGCHMHIAAGLRGAGLPIEVVHPLTLLARAHGLE